MPTGAKIDRRELAEKRIVSILTAHGIAIARTIEQKIADAGPLWMRINPHILTEVRNKMVAAGTVIRLERSGTPWFHLTKTPKATIRKRLAIQEPVHKAMSDGAFILRLGQVLEIATYRALLQQKKLAFFGGFPDVDQHDDGRPYSKVEPPQLINGASIHPRNHDFVVSHPAAGMAAIECKNVRDWMYPSQKDVKEMLSKCIIHDVVPVLIARRIPFVSFKLLYRCGIIVHETFNQRFPSADHALADLVRAKTNLGYHDVRTGNAPDPRLLKFICTDLPEVLPAARERFDAYKDLLSGFVSGEHDYKALAARVRRRHAGVNEDFDADDPPYDHDGTPEE